MTSPPSHNPPIVLTTDFGLTDGYVGVMKGVILNINPGATIIDLSHDIEPQNLTQGSFLLGTSHPYFPPGAIHVAVVDPGVGTDRKPIVLETPTAMFVAPDNGLLTEVVRRYLPSESLTTAQVRLPASLGAWQLTESRYRLEQVSNTFHGRDIFSPAAAYLSLGVAPSEMGPPVTELVYRPLPEPVLLEGVVKGEVIYIDRFGNLVTNISVAHTQATETESKRAIIEICGHRILGLSRTFHPTHPEPNDLVPSSPPLVALFGSTGHLEIAVPDGSAAAFLGTGVGSPVHLALRR